MLKITVNGETFHALKEAPGLFRNSLGYFWMGDKNPITKESRPYLHGPFPDASSAAMDKLKA